MPRRPRRALLIAAVVLAGCIQVGPGGDAVEQRTRHHALDPVTPPPTKSARKAPPMAVRPFSAPRRYEERVVRRAADGTLSFLEFERWAEAPADAVFHAAREGLAATGRFEAVFDAAVDHAMSLTLDGHVLACDLVQDPKSSARLRLRLDLGRRKDGAVLHSQVYEATRPLAGSGTAGLGAAMSQCVADVLTQALATWNKAGALSR